MKLGHAMGEMQKPSKYGVEKEFGCTLDDDCADTEKCINGICTNPCLSHPCPSGEFCLNEGNHSFTCVECTSNEQCEDREICKNNSCIDACYGDPCASKKQSCSSQSGHTYICYGCSSDEACDDTEACDISEKLCKPLCPDACPHQLCSIETPHRATCSGCTDDEGCAEGEICDLTEGSETINQCIVQSCESMVLAQRDDVAVAIDAATLSEALASSKPVIFIANDITYGLKISLENRKMVGANFFTDIPLCKMAEAPVLRIYDNVILENGEINNLKLISDNSNSFVAAVKGYGILNNISISSKENCINGEGGDLTLTGNNFLICGTYGIVGKSPVKVSGNLTFDNPSYNNELSVMMRLGDSFYSFPDSKIFLKGFAGSGIEIISPGDIIFDGNLIIENVRKWAISAGNYFTTDRTKTLSLSLNGNGNILSGILASALQHKTVIKINGETKIDPGHAISNVSFELAGDVDLTISSTATISAAINGYNPMQGYATVLPKITINAPINVGYAFRLPSTPNAQPHKLTKRAFIQSDYAFGGGSFSFEKGAKLEVKNVCKKASRNGTVSNEGKHDFRLSYFNYSQGSLSFPAGFDLPCD